jgi:uncharacterized repeat protein (TIGR02543 family)/LPXTG-motif cell wall-anchored protein
LAAVLLLMPVFPAMANQITAVASPADGGTVTGTDVYDSDSAATVTAVPADGFTFLGWYEGDSLITADSVYTFTVFAPRTLTAQFVDSARLYTVNASASPAAGGSVTGGGSYEYGRNIVLTAAANAGYTFSGWREGGQPLFPDPQPLSFPLVVEEDRTIEAVFVSDGSQTEGFTVTYNANGGTNAPQPQTKTPGQPLTLTSAQPTRSNWVFRGWHDSQTLGGDPPAAPMFPQGQTNQYTDDADITLFAIWEPRTGIPVWPTALLGAFGGAMVLIGGSMLRKKRKK